MYPEQSVVELTTWAKQRWYNNSRRKSTKKKDEYNEELITLYLAIINQDVLDEKLSCIFL